MCCVIENLYKKINIHTNIYIYMIVIQTKIYEISNLSIFIL